MLARPRLPSSPSELADSLANISLSNVGDDSGVASISLYHDGNETITDDDPVSKRLPPLPAVDTSNDDIDSSPHAITSRLDDIATLLEHVRAHFFVIQEQRHAGVFALVDNTAQNSSVDVTTKIDADDSGATPVKKSTAIGITGQTGSSSDEKNVALDMAMAQLNAYMEKISEHFVIVERQLAAQDEDADAGDALSSRSRSSSFSSIASIDSFNDAFGIPLRGSKAFSPAELRKRHAELSHEWTKIQGEAKSLEEELSGDKYNAVFHSMGEQLEEMMDSLDKALVKCHEFIFAFDREQERLAHRSIGETSMPEIDGGAGLNAQDRIMALQAVRRSFNVKRSSYRPACEQMFASLERGIKQRRTQNGMILRRHASLKARWRSLRERVSRMDKELGRIEAELTGHREQDHSPAGARSRGSPSAVRRSPLAGASSPSSLTKSTTFNHLSSVAPSHLSPRSRTANHHVQGYSSPSSADPNRSRELEATYDTLTRSPSLNAISSAATTSTPRGPDLARRSRPVTITLTPPRHGQSLMLSESAERRLSSSSQSSMSAEIARQRRVSSTSATSLGSSMPPVALPHQFRDANVNDGSMSSPGHTDADPGRPTSAAGMYYRPPSASGHRADAGISRIPRLSLGPTQSRRSSVVGERPGSALSQASTSTFNQGVTPRGAASSEAFLRLSMQTPEPTILARAQRANLFGPSGAAKRSSRPPPARYNAAGRVSMSSKPTRSEGQSDNAVYQPLSAIKRQSAQWSNGRTTPLSAAALSKVPSAQPTLDGFETPQRRGNPAPRSSVSGSVANYRAQRARPSAASQDLAASSHAPSVRSGRATPTFSDAGTSAWGGTAYSGRQSRAGTSIAIEPYKANPNDAIDVEVARVANGLGIHIERVDPPLPRGVKDLDPSNARLVKYMLGDKTIAVKLLQLHKPTIAQARGVLPAQPVKTKKLLTRVGGGWVDFESHCLSRMGTM